MSPFIVILFGKLTVYYRQELRLGTKATQKVMNLGTLITKEKI